ncbi:hypothetical protein ACIPX0_14385 [Streptomyces sp. NPDC090075]|uniref:hypothetical protein n=1 Tax=Streptomyces sp. NPDC090075 TaxID=3365937 RepID=UPI003810760E
MSHEQATPDVAGIPDVDAVLEAARAIRPYLPGLFPHAPHRAARLDGELARLLDPGAAAGAAESVLRALEGNAITKVWSAQFLEFGVPPEFVGSGTRGSTVPVPAGNGEALRPGPKYVCPANGDVVWWRRHVGQEVPRCGTHGLLLVKV